MVSEALAARNEPYSTRRTCRATRTLSEVLGAARGRGRGGRRTSERFRGLVDESCCTPKTGRESQTFSARGRRCRVCMQARVQARAAQAAGCSCLVS